MEQILFFEKYIQLRNQVDEACIPLLELHTGQMNCKKGCSTCCEKFSIFPIEFDSIRKSVTTDNTLKIGNPGFIEKFRNRCVFLQNSACSIYSERPIICRTQGFPLLYQNAEGTAYELSVCKLNFKSFEPNQFHSVNALFMPRFNSTLFLLNQEYIRLFHPGLKPNHRLPITDIPNYVK